MPFLISCQAVLFDMDGTLVDSTESVEGVWSRWAARHHLDVKQILAVSHGRRTLDTLRELALQMHIELDIENEARQLDEEEIHSPEGIREVPGAAVLLASLPTGRWCVVTSASRPLAEARLRAAGLPLPEILVCASDVCSGKPHPEGYLKAAAMLGFAPADCLVLEDTPAGLTAGRAAGMRVLALTTTYASNALLETACIPDFLGISVLSTAKSIELHG